MTNCLLSSALRTLTPLVSCREQSRGNDGRNAQEQRGPRQGCRQVQKTKRLEEGCWRKECRTVRERQEKRLRSLMTIEVDAFERGELDR